MNPINFEGLAAIILSLCIPMVAIIGGIILSIRKKQMETKLRGLIVENHTDLETAKALIEEQEKKSNKYGTLRGACVLIGLGFGALAAYLLNVEMAGPKGIYFWVILAFGVGLGLLAAFIIEQKLQKKQQLTAEE